MRLVVLMILFFGLFAPAYALAQVVSEPKPPKVLSDMVDKGAQIFYLGNYEDMNGWAIVRKGKPEIFYENKERTALIMGMMFNTEGDMVTMAQLNNLRDRVGKDMFAMTGGINTDGSADAAKDEKTVEVEAQPSAQAQESKPDAKPEQTPQQQTAPGAVSGVVPQQGEAVPAASPEEAAAKVTASPASEPATLEQAQNPNAAPLSRAEQMYVDLVSANWITMNPDGHYDIFAFIDPDCPHCQDFIKTVQPMLTPEGLRIRIIPVAMAEISIKRAAMLLAMANPADALRRYVNGEAAALNPPAAVNVEAAAKNVSLMYKYNFDVTPIIVYRTGQGAIRMVRGVPSDYAVIIRDMQQN